jgi:GNAT superfamily N-acetyltransferase
MLIQQQDERQGKAAPFRLEKAALEDFEAVAALFAALHAYNTSMNAQFALAANWRELLHEHFLHTHTADGALWMLARQGDEPVGLLVLENHTDSPLFQHRTWVELVALYVTPSCRKTGLAYQLMTQAYEWTARRGCDRMQLYVTTHNEHARSFYRRCGWRLIQEIWSLELSEEMRVENESEHD